MNSDKIIEEIRAEIGLDRGTIEIIRDVLEANESAIAESLEDETLGGLVLTRYRNAKEKAIRRKDDGDLEWWNTHVVAGMGISPLLLEEPEDLLETALKNEGLDLDYVDIPEDVGKALLERLQEEHGVPFMGVIEGLKEMRKETDQRAISAKALGEWGEVLSLCPPEVLSSLGYLFIGDI